MNLPSKRYHVCSFQDDVEIIRGSHIFKVVIEAELLIQVEACWMIERMNSAKMHFVLCQVGHVPEVLDMPFTDGS